MNIISTLKPEDLTDLLCNPDEWLDDEEDCQLVTIAHSDCKYYIFAGVDENGFYLILEDDDHSAYYYPKEENKTMIDLYTTLFNKARNKEEF